MKYQITRIGILRTGVYMGLLFLILFLMYCMVLLPFMLLGAMAPPPSGPFPGSPAASVGYFVGVIVALFIIIPVLAFIFGFIGGLIFALFYNLCAKMMGGLDIMLATTDALQQQSARMAAQPGRSSFQTTSAPIPSAYSQPRSTPSASAATEQSLQKFPPPAGESTAAPGDDASRYGPKG